MPSEHTHETPSSTEGPRLLQERSIGGILVHFVAMPTGVVGAGIVYLLATNEFTKRNARNALDWHLTVLGVAITTFGSLFVFAELTGQGATDVVVVPSLVASGAGAVISALFMLWTVVVFWTIIVGFVAMGKATFGTAWRYPLSPAVVDRIGSHVDLPGGWPLVILGYVMLLPVVMSGVFLGSMDGAAFFLSAFGLIGMIMVHTPLTAVAMYLHGERGRPRDADWRPHVVAYLGVPVAIAVIGYVLSGTVTDSINPAGDAMYVFLATFWISSIVYVSRWWTTEASQRGFR